MLLFLLPSLLLIPIAIFFYYYIKRSATFYHAPTDKRWVRMIIRVVAILMVVGAISPFSTQALFVYHLAVFCGIVELLNLLIKRITKDKAKAWKYIYSCGLLPIVLVAIVIGYGSYNMKNVRKTTYEVKTDKKIPSEGYKVAMLSDLHFGTTMDIDKLQKHCQEIGKENPDIVILCGDIVDNHTSKEEMQQAFEALSKIKNTKGIYYVYGNHDRSRDLMKSEFTNDELASTITGSGIEILRDSTKELDESLTLIGREDRGFSGEGRRKQPKELLAGVNHDKFLLLIDHQPQEYEETKKEGVDLEVSGHTHGGQIFPIGVISGVLGFGDLNYGYEKDGDFQAIVSSGIGGWGYAIRTGSVSEFVIIKIKPSL